MADDIVSNQPTPNIYMSLARMFANAFSNRQQQNPWGNIGFGQPDIISDDPRHGGITGNMPLPSRDTTDFSNDVLSHIGSGGSMDDVPDDTPATDAYIRAATHPPTGGRASNLRYIGTGLMSALQGFGEEKAPLYSTVEDAQGKRFQVPTSHLNVAMKQGYKWIKPSLWNTVGNQPLDFKEAESVVNAPYHQRVEDWKLQTGALEKAATFESNQDVKKELSRLRHAQAENIPVREERMGRQGDVRNDIASRRLDIENRKADLADWKAHNPNGSVKEVKGGNIVVIDPQSGEVIDTGIPSGSLTDAEKIRLTGEQQRQTVGTRGEETRRTLTQRGKQAIEQIDERAKEARETKKVIPGKAPSVNSDKPLSPTQQKTQQALRANRAVQEHPEWKPYLRVDPNDGMVKITPPSKGRFFSSGPKQEEYDRMLEYMKGTSSDTSETPLSSRPNTPAEQQPVMKQYSPSRNQTRISRDGGKTWTIIEGRQ